MIISYKTRTENTDFCLNLALLSINVLSLSLYITLIFDRV